MVVENYREIAARVAKACERCGRPVSEVTLIAVSKFKPVSMIRELMEIGVRDFGENHAQELVTKTEEITEPLNWHFIGNLQRNKVKYVVGRACMIHSLSSVRLAEEIQKEARKKGVRVPVLIEVNIADEDSKQGLAEEETYELVRTVAAMPELEVRGLMAIAPPVEDAEENRPHFRRLRQMLMTINDFGLPGVKLTELSMGMTGDFEVAIEEGATMIRVGTAIFGGR